MGRYHPIKKKPVKIPEQQVKPPSVGQPSDQLKQDVLLGDSTKKRANPGQTGDSSKQEAVAGERNDPTRQQANLLRAEAGDIGKRPVKTAAAAASVKQQERQESLKLGVKVLEDVERPGHAQEPSTHPVGDGKLAGPADAPADGAGSSGDKYSSLKRKPRTAAPPPPVVSDKTSSAPPSTTSQQLSHQAVPVDPKKTPPADAVEQSKQAKEQSTAVTQPQPQPQVDQQKLAGSLPPSSTAAEKTAHRVPARPAPARPAPARPAPAPPKQQNVSKPPAASVPPATSVPPAASVPPATVPTLVVDGSRTDKSAARLVAATTGPSEAAHGRSPNSQRRGGTMVSTYSREDGGKVLVVRQSPVLGRAVPGEVVFNFPPPPSREEDKRAAAGGRGRTKGSGFTSPSKSDASDDDTLLSPTKTDTSVEITNLDDVMSSSADEGEGRLVSEEKGVGGRSPQEDAGEEPPDSPVPEMADPDLDSDILPPDESEDGNGPSIDEPLSLPPPPSDFELMPPEPVFDLDVGDEDDGESVDGDGEGIVLLSIKPSDLLEDIPPPEIPSVGFAPHNDDEAAEQLLPPPPGISPLPSPPPSPPPSPSLTPPTELAPPSVFGTLPSGALPLAAPPPPPIKVSSSLSTPAPSTSGPQSTTVHQQSSSVGASPSLSGKAPISSSTITRSSAHQSSSGFSTPPSPLPPSLARYPAQAVTDHPTPPPPSIPPPPSGYPTPPPLRAYDSPGLSSNGGHFYSPLDSPALVPPPIDSPMDSPGLYQTGSLTLLDPPSIPESWQTDHLSFVPPPPDSSPPISPSLAAPSSPVPHPPPPPPLTFWSKTSAPLVKPKPPAAMRLKQMGGTFSEGEDYAHGGNRASLLNKHPLSVKSKAPPVTKWKSLDEGDGQAELLSKLQERKAKLKEPATSGAQTVAPPVSGGGGDSMQVQLQMLQQQMLQQQMMQLQQQFQQLQMANMGYGVPPMGLGLYQHQPVLGGANPGLLSTLPMGTQPGGVAFPLGYMPHGSGVGPALGMPSFGMVGISSQPAVAPSSSLPGTASGYPVMTPGVSQPALSGASGEEAASLPRRASRDELARSEKLGKMEEKFDNLMSEVRETDPSLVLKKVRQPLFDSKGLHYF